MPEQSVNFTAQLYNQLVKSYAYYRLSLVVATKKTPSSTTSGTVADHQLGNFHLSKQMRRIKPQASNWHNWWWLMFYGHLCSRDRAKRAERPPKVMKRSQRWNTLQICPPRDSNSVGTDQWSNTLPVRPLRRPGSEDFIDPCAGTPRGYCPVETNKI